MNKQIARRLGLSLSTVKNHVHNILRKQQLGSRHEVACPDGDGTATPDRIPV